MVEWVESILLGFFMGVGSQLAQYFIQRHVTKRIENLEGQLKDYRAMIKENGYKNQ